MLVGIINALSVGCKTVIGEHYVVKRKAAGVFSIRFNTNAFCAIGNRTGKAIRIACLGVKVGEDGAVVVQCTAVIKLQSGQGICFFNKRSKTACVCVNSNISLENCLFFIQFLGDLFLCFNCAGNTLGGGDVLLCFSIVYLVGVLIEELVADNTVNGIAYRFVELQADELVICEVFAIYIAQQFFGGVAKLCVIKQCTGTIRKECVAFGCLRNRQTVCVCCFVGNTCIFVVTCTHVRKNGQVLQSVGGCIVTQTVTRHTNGQTVFGIQIIFQSHFEYGILFVFGYVAGCLVVSIQLLKGIVGAIGFDVCLTLECIGSVGHFGKPYPKNGIFGLALVVLECVFTQCGVSLNQFQSHTGGDFRVVEVVFFPSVNKPLVFILGKVAFLNSLLDVIQNVGLEAVIKDPLRNQFSTVFTTDDVLNTYTALNQTNSDLIVHCSVGVAIQLLGSTGCIGKGNDNLRKQFLLCGFRTLRGCYIVGVAEQNVFGRITVSICFNPSNFTTLLINPQLVVALGAHQLHSLQLFLGVVVNLGDVVLNGCGCYRVGCCCCRRYLNGKYANKGTQHHNDG